MTVDQLNRQLRTTLEPALGSSEADAAARIILEDAAGISRVDLAARGDRELEQFTADRLMGIARRVAVDGVPVQYAVGQARFYGMNLRVTPDVLIPRPETEGLVDMIVRDAADRSDLSVLDACTGSGCIAIALARTLPFARVDAFDISEAALNVARENAARLKAKVNFRRADALNLVPEVIAVYDIIVSNPPYVVDSERAAMDPRVLLHEPAGALFVPDTDPLRFYRPLGVYAQRALRPGGRLYFEVNALYAADVAALLKTQGFDDAAVSLDFHGRPRYVVATKHADA